jgi:hypothetical protein|nr:hypothetical protein [Neorhizobium tomejilense]
MLFDMEHPAIVSRRKRSGEEPEFALVRTTSRIEVPDYAVGDVQTAAILHHSAGSTTYRKIGSHLFKQMDNMPATALKPGSDMMSAVIGRVTTFDFGAFMRHIQDAAFDVANDENTLHRNVAYLDRPLTRSEMKQKSTSSLLKAFEKAPVMGSQIWLGADAETQRQEWSEKFAAFMRNVAIVDGIVHVRSFEPCLTMRLSRNDRYVSFGKLAYMEQYLDDPRHTDRRGIPYLGDEDSPGERYFSLNEQDRAADIANELGCANEVLIRAQTTSATVIDPSALSPDFLDEETYRVAVHALQVSHDIANDLVGISYLDRADRQRLDTRLKEIAVPEKALTDILAPTAELETGAIAQATDCLMATLRRDGEILGRETAGALAQLETSLAFLETRRDAMPISLDRVAPFRFGG